MDVRLIEGEGTEEVSEDGAGEGTSSARRPEASPQALPRDALPPSGRELGTSPLHPHPCAQPSRCGARAYSPPGRRQGASPRGARPRPCPSGRIAGVSIGCRGALTFSLRRPARSVADPSVGTPKPQVKSSGGGRESTRLRACRSKIAHREQVCLLEAHSWSRSECGSA